MKKSKRKRRIDRVLKNNNLSEICEFLTYDNKMTILQCMQRNITNEEYVHMFSRREIQKVIFFNAYAVRISLISFIALMEHYKKYADEQYDISNYTKVIKECKYIINLINEKIGYKL